ncbi:NAD-dependent epimerase/dehydratase family protein [Halorubrum vacuolatum]|uniref:Nucleoside-diphosphate-sugar epimerase n=1 Tax=Halorubrum vacuolatum TaxID=63740 RepID=A0A238X3K9_HALVU|nr:NAD-dependent epimerase/dehydratase family protein [Halorubrum vacuolatum]SNR53517.1 Nucleoside-diphosphate-sugar epimerase [Halorubrum vacuolatum]
MSVVIVGCGYVGMELARQLASRGHEVTGVRRSEAGMEAIEALEAEGDGSIAAVGADATDPESLAVLPDANAVVFAASSGGRGATAARTVYVEGLKAVIEEYRTREEPPDRIVYTSSTGVYGDHGGAWVDESTPIEPTTEKTRVLAEAERVAIEGAEAAGIDGTVARFAGLYGPDRYRLQRYLDGPVTAGYLNMVHRDDAAGAVRYLLEGDLARGEPVVVVDDEPADKHAFADWLADECGTERPAKQSKAERITAGDLSEPAKRRILTSKRCSNAYLRELGYSPAYPTFREGYRAAIDAFRAERG